MDTEPSEFLLRGTFLGWALVSWGTVVIMSTLYEDNEARIKYHLLKVIKKVVELDLGSSFPYFINSKLKGIHESILPLPQPLNNSLLHPAFYPRVHLLRLSSAMSRKSITEYIICSDKLFPKEFSLIVGSFTNPEKQYLFPGNMGLRCQLLECIFLLLYC